MATRGVAWPHDIAAVARSLAETPGWFWLDGEAPDPDGTRGRSYLGCSDETIRAAPGSELRFLGALQHGMNRGEAWVVALSYEFGVALMGEQAATDSADPAFAIRASTMLVLDHARQAAELQGPSEAALDAWLARHGQALESGSPWTPSKPGESRPPGAPKSRGAATENDEFAGPAQTDPVWRASDPDYLRQIEQCKHAISEGQAYVLCLTDVAECSARNVDPLRLFTLLRKDAAATRGAVIVAGDRALVSASPERFMSVRGRTIATHPIKGTRPRGLTPEQDAAHAAELANDPKERAENLMIVDLMRNDLSRVCKPGTVATTGFLRVESHARVHQLVSTVTGTLREANDASDAVLAMFPGGSMTGAPKASAVQLLAQLEGGARGLYAGCFGLFTGDAVELAMSIRCVELRDMGSDGAVARVGAGGGITSDSDPEAELAEKHLKAAPLLAAIERARSE